MPFEGAYHSRWIHQRGIRPVRIANCSGARSDPGYQMLRQATLGDVDFVTGDYLAEFNLPENAEAMAAGKHEGWEPTAWDGLRQTMETLNVKRTKVIINGGALNPLGLAKKCQALITEKNYSLTVAAVTGDNLLEEVRTILLQKGSLPEHLDSSNNSIHLAKNIDAYVNFATHPLVSAHAYLGARGIVKALSLGADIVICGRVADASPVIGAAWWWFEWAAMDYDSLAGCLVAGHLIECSSYVTGANFAGFDRYDLELLIDLAFGIVEVERDGSCVVTKHEGSRGMVTEDTVKCQFLYELQGNVYLNCDVKAYLDNVQVASVGENRVRLSGIRGAPPPPTTKLAIFYRGGYQAQLLLNATGYATREKWALYEKQLRHGLQQKGVLDQFDVLDFQIVGVPQPNPTSQLRSTTYCRIFAQAAFPATLAALSQTMVEFLMQHFSGWHGSLDFRTAVPLPFLAYYPALYPQARLQETAHILAANGEVEKMADAGHPEKYEELEKRQNYDAEVEPGVEYGHTKRVRLGDIALGRSGDKGSNVNFGVFVASKEMWPWFRKYMTRRRMQLLMGDDWREEYFVERVEFSEILAVHFVIYGLLGRGVTSSTSLDSLGKGFADFIRDREVDVPVRFVGQGSSQVTEI